MSKPPFNEYISMLDKQLADYIPPRDQWLPVDKAIFPYKDIYRVPLKEAEQHQLKSIKYTFTHHYNNNQMYHNFCKENKITPDDITTSKDLEDIPLIPDKFFKDYPTGRDFATWLANIYTGKLPKIIIQKKNPTYDEIINAFNNAGMTVSYSSGTGGRHTFIPRDQRTFFLSEYTIAKSAITMFYPIWEPTMHGYLLMPNPKKTNVYAGKVCTIYFDAIADVKVAIDREISTDLIQMTMSDQGGLKGRIIRRAAKRAQHKIIENIIKWLHKQYKSNNKIALVGAPFLAFQVLNTLKERGEYFDFGDRGGVATGGGWKVYEDHRIPTVEFQKQVKDILGIPEKNVIDLYGMVEGNGWMAQCPEGHYLHIPYSYYKPLVLNDEYKPVGYNEWGRYAFLDAAALSYPGFIISGDKVRMLEHCPICDRPGPVLEPEIKRAEGEDIRGCAEELRRMLSSDLGS